MAGGGSLAAAVAVSGTAFSFDRAFHYAVPPELASVVRPGVRVIVPFGRGNRKRVGFVLRIEQPEAGVKLKPVLAAADAEPVMNDELLALVEWLHETTFCTYYDSVKTILPSGMNLRIHETYALAEPDSGVPLSEAEQNLLTFMRMAKSRRELDAMLDTALNPDKAETIHSLLQKGYITEENDLQRTVKDSFFAAAACVGRVPDG